MANIDEIEMLCSKQKPVMLACSESRITSEILKSEYKISGYNEVECFSNSRHTGGTICYINDQIKYKVIRCENIECRLWFTSIEIWNSQMDGIYHTFYRSPDGSVKNDETLKILEEFLEKSVNLGKLNVIMGDLNFDLNNNKLITKKIKSLFNKFELIQMVNFDTRVNNKSSTQIDVILTNNPEMVECKPLHEDEITDHKTIEILIKKTNKKQIKQELEIISWKEYNKEKLIDELRQINWSNLNKNDINDEVKLIRENLMNAVKKITKKIKVKANPIDKRWFDPQLKNKKICKINSYNKWSLNKTEENWDEYKSARNEYSKLLKIKKCEYNRGQIKAAMFDQKQMWKCLNKMISNKKSKASDEIIFEGVSYRNEKEICEKFNSYFINSIIQISEEIENGNENNIQIENSGVQFKFKRVDVDDVKRVASEIAKKINKSELLNSKVWLDSIDYIGHFITEMINRSLQGGEFPDEWKTSTIHPIPKLNNTKNAHEFRPINTMPSDEKMIEMIVKEQLMQYVEQNNILNKYQSAYRTNHSCETALNYVINDWSKLVESGHIVVVVFLDLKRAFETIDRNRLLEKLKMFGIRDIEWKWFRNFLKNRNQKTRYLMNESSRCEIPIGLPQGTQLSVILFILYINDIISATTFASIMMFADDTTITISARDVDTAIKQMEIDLKNILNWLNSNKLKLNVNKTKWMIISNKKCEFDGKTLKINDESIERVKQIKYLGVIINDKIKMDDQIEVCANNAAKKVNLLKRISKKLTFESKKTIYNTIVAPNFEFCSTLYINGTKEQINILQMIQNRAMRVILKCDYRTPRKFMLNALDWLSIEQKIMLNVIVMVFKMKNKNVPKYLYEQISYVGENQERMLRNRNNFKLPNAKTENTRNSIFYLGLKLYNELPDKIKKIESLPLFKEKCKSFVREKFPIV